MIGGVGDELDVSSSSQKEVATEDAENSPSSSSENEQDEYEVPFDRMKTPISK